MAIHHFGRAGLDRLDANLYRQVPGGSSPIAVHRHDQGGAFVFLPDERLDHREWVEAEDLRAALDAAARRARVSVSNMPMLTSTMTTPTT
jgi:hypothetical protein